MQIFISKLMWNTWLVSSEIFWKTNPNQFDVAQKTRHNSKFQISPWRRWSWDTDLPISVWSWLLVNIMDIAINIKHYRGLCENPQIFRDNLQKMRYVNFSDSNFRGIQYSMNINEFDTIILQIMHLLQSNDKSNIVKHSSVNLYF